MANPLWPASLPDIQYPAPGDGYQRDTPNAVITSNMSAGPPKERPRSSATYDTVQLNVDMTEDQFTTLRDFYETTLSRTGPFDWIDHYTRDAATYKFSAKPHGTPLGLDERTGLYWWTVRISLEMLP